MGVMERDVGLGQSIEGLSMRAIQTDEALLHGVQVADVFLEHNLSLL
jgi:hypothetical protein